MKPHLRRTLAELTPLLTVKASLQAEFGKALTETHSGWAARTQLPPGVYQLDGLPDERTDFTIGPLIISPKAMEPTIQGLLNLFDLAHGDPSNPFLSLNDQSVAPRLVYRLERLIRHSITTGHGALAAQGLGGKFLGVGTFGDPAGIRPHWEDQALPSSNGRPACHADMSIPKGWADRGVMRAMAEQLLRSAWQEGHGTLIFDLDPANKQSAEVLEGDFGAVRLRPPPARAEGMPPTSWWAAPTMAPPTYMAMARALAAETHPRSHFIEVLNHQVSAKPPSASAKQAPTKRLPAPM